tara:strand:+ start:959 stop:1627 length:669 start_codon:yes stop_codon:yes gene_type:complete
MLKGNQKKLDKNKDGKISGEDFKILRGTKKGMRMGGEVKPIKAVVGALIGIGGAMAAKKFLGKKKKSTMGSGPGGLGTMAKTAIEKKKELLTGKKMGGVAKKMGGGMMKMNYKEGGPARRMGRGDAKGKIKARPDGRGGGRDAGNPGALTDAISRLKKRLKRPKITLPERGPMIPLAKKRKGGALDKKGVKKIVLGFRGKAKDYPGAKKIQEMNRKGQYKNK